MIPSNGSLINYVLKLAKHNLQANEITFLYSLPTQTWQKIDEKENFMCKFVADTGNCLFCRFFFLEQNCPYFHSYSLEGKTTEYKSKFKGWDFQKRSIVTSIVCNTHFCLLLKVIMTWKKMVDIWEANHHRRKWKMG